MPRVKVASAQLPHKNYNVANNIERGVAAVKEAAAKEAKLVLLPEFFSTGYMFNTELWEMAEVLEGGPTLTAMTKVANECDICVAFTILEAASDGSNDFYNTFVLVEPSGRKHVCHKSEPAAFECWVFKGDASLSPVFSDTCLGKIAASICYENMLVSQQHRLLQNDGNSVDEKAKTPFDLLLCPHSAPTTNECLSFPKPNVLAMNQLLEQTPMRMAKLFGVPVVMSNKIGPIESKNPFPFWMIPTKHTFRGFSSICGGDCFWLSAATNKLTKEKNDDKKTGTEQPQEKEEPEAEVVVGNVFMGDDNRKIVKVKTDLDTNHPGRYLVTLPSPLDFVWTYIMEPIGRLSYALSYGRRRSAVARAIARGSKPSTYQPSSSASRVFAPDWTMFLWGAVAAIGAVGIKKFEKQS